MLSELLNNTSSNVPFENILKPHICFNSEEYFTDLDIENFLIIFNFPVDSRATTPHDCESIDKIDQLNEERANEMKLVLDKSQSEEDASNETLRDEVSRTDDEDKNQIDTSEMSTTGKKKKQFELGTNVVVPSLEKPSDPNPIASQKSKLTGKTRTGWI